jgi:hypothetical protein
MSGTGGFQTSTTDQPAFAVAGDFASQNPYFTFDAGPGGSSRAVGSRHRPLRLGRSAS